MRQTLLMTSTVTLDRPRYGASFGTAVVRFYRKYATFTGRASRSEYWWVQLLWVLSWIPLIVAFIIDVNVSGGPQHGPGPVFGVVAVIWVLFMLASIVPQIALFVRRMHDVNLSGLLVLLHLIPSIGAIICIVLAALPSNPAGERYDAPR